MTKFNLNNNGKAIGKGNINDKNIKMIFTKGAVIAGLSFGLGLTLATIAPKDEIKIIEVKKEEPEKDPDLRLNIEDGVITPHDDVAPAYYSLDQNNKVIYDPANVDPDNKIITFVPTTNITKYGYILDDSIDPKYEWCDYYYHKLEKAVQLNDNKVDPDFRGLEKEYENLNVKYDEYIDQGASLEKDEALKASLESFADKLALWVGTSYKPQAIPQAEVERVNDIKELEGVGGPYFRVTDYKVAKDSTLSEIIHGYANNSKQYEELYEQAIKDNNLDNPDLIYEGQLLTLTGLDEEDLNNMNYRLPNEAELVDQYEAYFNYVLNEGITTLTGDNTGMEMKADIISGINDFKILMHEPGDKDVLEVAKSVAEKIEVLTGNKLELIAHKR